MLFVTNHAALFVSISQHDHTLVRIAFCRIPIGQYDVKQQQQTVRTEEHKKQNSWMLGISSTTVF